MGSSCEPSAIPIISFIGHHNAGKTQLLTRVVEELTHRGLRVGAVKRAPNHEPARAQDTDSERLQSAGALRTMLWGQDQAILNWRCVPSDRLPTELSHLFFDCDLVLMEGHKFGPFAKIEVYRRGPALPHEPLAGAIDVVAVISDEILSLPDGLTRFSPSDIKGVCDYLETHFLTR